MAVAVTRPRAQGYGVQLGSDWYRVPPTQEQPLSIVTRDSLAPRQDQRGSFLENVLDLGYLFTRPNLTGGEGLDWYPRQAGESEQKLDATRYWDSGDVAVRRPKAGDPYGLRLIEAAATFWTPASAPVDMAASADRLYVIAGTNVYRFNDLGDTTPDDTDDLLVTLTQIVASPDNQVTVLDNTGDVWFKGANTEVYLKVYDTPTNGVPVEAVWWVKDRIVAARRDTASAAKGALIEIAPGIGGTPAAPTATPVISVVDSYTESVYDVVDAGHAIVGAFSDGTLRSYVPQTDTAGGTPTLTIRGRSQVPHGEKPYAMAANLGVLLVLTQQSDAATTSTVRLYSASVLDERFDYVTGNLQLLRVWEGSGETTPAYTKNMVTTRDEIMFWILEAPSQANLWRYDLVTTGLFRDRLDQRTSAVGTVSVDGRLVWITGANVVYTTPGTFKATGYLITPNITFGLNTPINWTSFTVEASNLDVAGVAVKVYYSLDPQAITDRNHATWVLVANITDPAHSGVENPKVNLTGNQLSLKIELEAATALTSSPEVTNLAVRGLPQHRDWIVEVPINISDQVTAPGRAPLHLSGWGDTIYRQILDKQGTNTTLVLLNPPITIRGVVDTVGIPVTYYTKRGSQGRVAVVRFRGVRVADSAASSSTGAGVGLGLLGVSTTGIGQRI